MSVFHKEWETLGEVEMDYNGRRLLDIIQDHFQIIFGFWELGLKPLDQVGVRFLWLRFGNFGYVFNCLFLAFSQSIKRFFIFFRFVFDDTRFYSEQGLLGVVASQRLLQIPVIHCKISTSSFDLIISQVHEILQISILIILVHCFFLDLSRAFWLKWKHTVWSLWKKSIHCII